MACSYRRKCTSTFNKGSAKTTWRVRNTHYVFNERTSEVIDKGVRQGSGYTWTSFYIYINETVTNWNQTAKIIESNWPNVFFKDSWKRCRIRCWVKEYKLVEALALINILLSIF
jgi:hypothetical protein